ncbi:MAG: GTPase Era [Proteobacteria bacterium]|nr:GTPase Era [Pseudomonadota bacterium]
MENYKAGFVTIIGLPNAGKSTLLNILINTKLAPVSPKPQMTRKSVVGILTGDGYQAVFLDSPGIIEPSYLMQEYMMKDITRNIADADIVIVVIDVSRIESQKRVLLERIKSVLSKKESKKLFVLNKTDIVKQNAIITSIKWISDNFQYDDIFPISCKRGQNVEELKNMIIKYLPEHEPYYDSDILSVQSERFFVKEFILETIYDLLKKELPYSCLVEIEEFKEREGGKDYIRAVIFVEKDSHKKIIIGRNGSMMKDIGRIAREKIEKMHGKPVFLELFVKTLPDWKNRKDIIRKIYKED